MTNTYTHTHKYQDTIVEGLSKLPYGLRYICMSLKKDLREKFPEVHEDDICKVSERCEEKVEKKKKKDRSTSIYQ